MFSLPSPRLVIGFLGGALIAFTLHEVLDFSVVVLTPEAISYFFSPKVIIA